MRMKIGILGPTEPEISPLLVKMINVKTAQRAMLTFHEGLYEGIEVVALHCGICKVNAAIAAQLLIDRFEVTHIIVTGVAGAIDKSLKIGDTVVSTQVAYHDVDDEFLTQYHPHMKSSYFSADAQLLSCFKRAVNDNGFRQKILFGKMVTGEAFIVQNDRQRIIEKFDPLCVDMETAGIAHVCFVNRIPYIAIRSMSDTAEHCGLDTFEENCAQASRNSIEVIERALKELNLYTATNNE